MPPIPLARRTAAIVGGLIVDYAADGEMMTGTRTPLGPYVAIARAGMDNVLACLAPDDADRLADELRAAAQAARGKETT